MFKTEEQAKQEIRVKQAAASRANPVWVVQGTGPGKGLFYDLQSFVPIPYCFLA
jgi:hypothetical protein